MITRIEQGIVVVPWNFSENSRAALEHAVNMVDDPNSIRVVHVAAPLTGPDNGALYIAAEDQNRQEIEQRFRELLLDDPRLTKVDFHIVHGRPGREITAFARRHNADMIVMSSRKRQGIAKLLRRRLTESVVSDAHCPVLVLRQSQNASVAC